MSAPGERPITERSATDLARAIRDGELTATEVVVAHIARHREFAPRVNALAAERFGAAEAEAAVADARVAAAGVAGRARLPPLLGVPFTLKESIALKGMPQSAGLIARETYRAKESAPAAARIVAAGGIPLGVTNLSELTLGIESVNRVYGRTNNPYDPGRTAGGSSGGEGAAVGCGGSPFGIASDIAGSIRFPAFFCGVFGHKPSPGVVPNSGMFPASQGEAGRLLSVGPLARRAEDLMPVLRLLAGPDAGDPYSRATELGDPATIALAGLPVTSVEGSVWLPVSRELRDVREQAIGALRAAGGRVRRIHASAWRRATLPYLAALQSGSERSTGELLEDVGAPRPGWRSLLRPRGPHTATTRLTLASERLPQLEGPGLARQLRRARDLAAEVREAIGDGVLLHLVSSRVAPRHSRSNGRPWLFTPAAIFNLAGVPVTEVPLGLDRDGLPLGIQVAAGPGRDHVAIAVALELERVFGGWVPPGLPR